MLAHRQPAHGVLHHHHRAVHDQPEVHRAQAQQAGRDARLQHQVAREQHRERNGRRHHQARPQVAQEREEDRDHQQRPRQQVVFDGVDDVVHQFRAVIEHLHDHVLGQRLLHFGEFVFQAVRDHRAVLPHEHEAQPQHDFPFARARHRAAPDFVVHLHLGHVAHPHRHAVVRRDDDVGDFLDVRGQAQAMHQQRLPAAHHLAAAHVLVVRLQRLKELFERQAVFHQPLRLGDDVELLLESAPGVDFRHAAHLAQLRLDHPILDLAQFRERAVGVVRADHVMEHLAQARWRWGRAGAARCPPATRWFAAAR